MYFRTIPFSRSGRGRKLYFQFSFLERTRSSIREVKERCDTPESLFPIPFSLEQVRSALLGHCWEPAAEATLLTLCAKEFGRNAVADTLAIQGKTGVRYGRNNPGSFRRSTSSPPPSSAKNPARLGLRGLTRWKVGRRQTCDQERCRWKRISRQIKGADTKNKIRQDAAQEERRDSTDSDAGSG
jgi:hypothetical protein